MSRQAREHRRARRITFPEFSKVLEGRDNLVDVISRSYVDLKGEPVMIVSGANATRGHATVYHRLLIRAGWSNVFLPDSAIPDKGTRKRISEWGSAQVALSGAGRCPRMVIYVGGQSVGDAAKVLVKHWRGDGDEPVFGGIITALSTDGVFAKNASLRGEDGLSKTEAGTPPDFVLGHRLTLLRQPYQMKLSCLGDILTKASSLWDYDYACRKLNRYHDDFARDLVRSAYEPLLLRGEERSEDDKLARRYLHLPSSIDDMFRSIQLCGLSMQLLGESDTCSGSEHLGQKWLDEFVATLSLKTRSLASTNANDVESMSRATRSGSTDPETEAVPRARRSRDLSHGESVLPMGIITLYMQGQAEVAEKIKNIAVQTNMAFSVGDLGIHARAVCTCLTLGLGDRCSDYLAYLLDIADFPDESKCSAQRITILEQQEVRALPSAVRYAMLDSGVAKESDFALPLSSKEKGALHGLVERAVGRLSGDWQARGLEATKISRGVETLRDVFVGAFESSA